MASLCSVLLVNLGIVLELFVRDNVAFPLFFILASLYGVVLGIVIELSVKDNIAFWLYEMILCHLSQCDNYVVISNKVKE